MGEINHQGYVQFFISYADPRRTKRVVDEDTNMQRWFLTAKLTAKPTTDSN